MRHVLRVGNAASWVVSEALRGLAVQDAAAQPDPRAAAKKAKVDALWAQLNGGLGGAAAAAASSGRAGTPGAAQPCPTPGAAQPGPEAGPAAPAEPSQAARPPRAGSFSLATLCRPVAKRGALEDKDRVSLFWGAYLRASVCRRLVLRLYSLVALCRPVVKRSALEDMARVSLFWEPYFTGFCTPLACFPTVHEGQAKAKA